MKIFIIDICIWILRKLKVSTIIGVQVGIKDGSAFIRTQYDIGRWYDSTLHCMTYTSNWKSFDISNKIPFEYKEFDTEK